MRRIALIMPVIALVLGGCSNALNYEVAIGASEKQPSVAALSIAAVTKKQGTARLSGTLLNRGDNPDRLVRVEASSERGSVSAHLEAAVTLRAGEPLRLARNRVVTLKSDHLVPGYLIDVTFVFEGAAPVSMKVPVEAQDDAYADIEVTESPDGDVAPPDE